MKQYIVTLTESYEETVVGRYSSLNEAKQHLRNVRYYPEYRRTAETLDIDEDGMSGTGYNEDGYFTYTIKVRDQKTPYVFSLEMFRNGLCRRFEWYDGFMFDYSTGEQAPMSWQEWQMLPYDLRKQGFKPFP